MKTTIKIVSIVAMLGALIQLGIVLLADPPMPGNTMSSDLFNSFPAGREKKVEFSWGGGSLRHLTERQKKDQALDWLVLSVLSDSGVPRNELNKLAFDLPPVRVGYLEPIAQFEYGGSRTRFLGQGIVLALVPKQDIDQRLVSLEHIADEQRKNSGQIPKTLIVFQYDLATDWAGASLSRLPDVAGSTLYTSEVGYQEKQIVSSSDLNDFLRSTNDLTYSSLQNGTFVVGGRSLPVRFRHITLEDVAALWKSEKSIKVNRAKVDAFNAKWDNQRYHTQYEKSLLEAQYKTELAELQKEIPVSRQVRSSGFSLDPTLDYTAMSTVIEKLSGLLSGYATPEQLQKIETGLQARDEGPLYDLLDQMNNGKDDSAKLGVQLLEAVLEKYKFQQARYDGDLRGTEVGMTLFYTDLLAKLKALEFWGDSPITDFIPLTRVRVSTVYREELKAYSNTRLWFGPLDQGYQNTGDTLLFARNATRIYAASSNTFTPGKEAQPNAESHLFLGWWNDHYEDVAQYETEYERLNQIMKWSLLISWLNERDATDRLSSLSDVQIDHSAWFMDWVHHHPELRFQDWNRVPFYARGYKGATTETMPLLQSADFLSMGQIHYLAGGVSLASEDAMRARTVLPKAVGGTEDIAFRSGVDYAHFQPGDTNTLTMLDKTEHAFSEQAGGIVDTISKAAPEAKFRGLDAELANAQVERKYLLAGSDLRIEVKIGPERFGEFSTQTVGDTLRVGFQELEMDRAHDLAEEVSSALARNQSADELLAQNPRIELAIAQDCEGCYFVKLRGTDRWLKLEKDANPGITLKDGWQARVSALDRDDAPTVNIAFVEKQNVVQELQSQKYLVVARDQNTSAGVPLKVSNKGPPGGSPPEHVRIGGADFEGRRGPDGTIYIGVDKLSPVFSDNPLRLGSLLGDEEHPAQQLISKMQVRDYESAADQIAADPLTLKRQLNQLADKTGSDLDQALAQGRDAVATRDAGLLSQIRSSPDLLAKQSIAQLSQDPGRAVESIRQALRSPLQSPDSIFQIVDSRLATGTLPTGEQADLLEIASMLDLKRFQQAANLDGHLVPFLSDKGRVAFDVQLVEQVKGTTVTAEEAARSGGPLYVLDGPGLNTNDWIIRINHVVDETVAHDLGAAVRLPRWDLAEVQPEAIQTADGRRWIRVNEATAPLRNSGGYRRLPSDGRCDPQVDATCDRSPYLIERQTKTASLN
jgi:hypothetical protein